MIDDTAIDRFHAHLDECAQCANHPFQLCPAGHKLLMETSEFDAEENV